MKKGKSYPLRLTAICFLFYVPAFCHPTNAFDIQSTDTAWYFNEHGKLIGCDVHAGKTASYVIKTRKKTNQIFNDLQPEEDTVIRTVDYTPAAVRGISKSTARKVERLIRKNNLQHALVKANVVEILDRSMLVKMYHNIETRCNTPEGKNFREHGGVVLPDGTITCITGDVSDPRTFEGAELKLKDQAKIYYHSHPCGCVDRNNKGSLASLEENNANRVDFSHGTSTEWICYIQGPSRQDQDAVGDGVGYVFGMNADSHMIYIYDHDGVKATLPLSFVKKSERPKVR